MLSKLYIPSYHNQVKNIKMFDKDFETYRAFILIAHSISIQYPKEFCINQSEHMYVWQLKDEFKRTLNAY